MGTTFLPYSERIRSSQRPIKFLSSLLTVVALAMLFTFVFGAVAPLGAVTIDGFSTNQGPLVGNATTGTVSGAGILGGDRDVLLYNSTTISLQADGGVLRVIESESTNASMAWVTYDGVGSIGLGPIDLTDGGASDRFLLDVTTVTSLSQFQPSPGAFVQLYIEESSGNYLISDWLDLEIRAPGVYELFFDDMTVFGSGANPAAANSVRLVIDIRYYSSISIGSFSTGGSGIEPPPDTDGDGISDAVDGKMVGGAFVDESNTYSDNFTDENINGTSYGTSFGYITSRSGLAVTVDDEPHPDGLLLSASDGTGTANIRVCDLSPPDGRIQLTDGDVAVVTCGSLTMEVFTGPVEVILSDGDIIVTVPTDAVISITEVSGEEYYIENTGTAGAITVLQNGVPETLEPGESESYFSGPQQITIAIDIKPGTDGNKINLKSKGVIPVAILTTGDFDATIVDPLSVEFGPNGAMEAHGKGHIEDVDEDGDFDLVFHFKTQETGIECYDTEASLIGETFDGQYFMGSDNIITLGCE